MVEFTAHNGTVIGSNPIKLKIITRWLLSGFLGKYLNLDVSYYEKSIVEIIICWSLEFLTKKLICNYTQWTETSK